MSKESMRMIAKVYVTFEGWWYLAEICRVTDVDAVLDRLDAETHGRDLKVGFHLSRCKLGPRSYRPWEAVDAR